MDYNYLQSLLVNARGGLLTADRQRALTSGQQALDEFPAEPDVYLLLAETYSRHVGDIETYARNGNYLKAINYAKQGLKKIGNTDYIKFNNGKLNDTEGKLYYWLAYSFWFQRMYGVDSYSFSKNDAEKYAKKAKNLLGDEDSNKLLKAIRGW